MPDDHAVTDSDSEIQTIDATSLRAGSADSGDRVAALEALRSGFERTGFAVITGHGIAPSVLEGGLGAADRFFALPAEAKHSVAPRRWNPSAENRYRGYFPSSVNGKEGLDLGDPTITAVDHDLLARPYYEVNALPEAFADADRAAIDDYFAALSTFGATLARAMIESLGGEAASLLRALARPGSQSTLRFNRYPPEAEPVEVSRDDGTPLACETHVDSGFVTLLYQDRRGGLQLRDRRRNWIDVPYRENALVVNLGRAGEALVGGRFRATPHRVRHEPGARLSIPFFLEPRHDFPIAPSAVGLAQAETTPPPSYEAFLDDSLAKFEEYAGR